MDSELVAFCDSLEVTLGKDFDLIEETRVRMLANSFDEDAWFAINLTLHDEGTFRALDFTADAAGTESCSNKAEMGIRAICTWLRRANLEQFCNTGRVMVEGETNALYQSRLACATSSDDAIQPLYKFDPAVLEEA